MSEKFDLDPACAEALNREAREQEKLRLLRDIRMDLVVCEIEGWDQMEYIRELQDLLDSFRGGKASGLQEGNNQKDQ